jgi:hypothetical protein
MVQWFGVVCHCRCRHCLLESGRGVTGVPFELAKAVAERFARWREAQGKPDFSADLSSGYPSCSPYVEECLIFNARHGGTHPHVALNGRPLADETGLRKFLLGVKQAGAVAVNLTFYGSRDCHDRWAGREGDFEHLLLASRLAVDCGLPRSEIIFVPRGAIEELPALLETLDGIPGLESRCIALWDYRGRGKRLERERPTLTDFDRLPQDIRAQINLGAHGGCRPEAEWIQRILAGDFHRKSRRYYLLTVREDTIEWLSSADCGAILQRVRDVDDRLLEALPSLATLAQLYGRGDGDRLYTLRDLEWKWVDAHLKAHPEIDPAGRFSDFDTVVHWS